MARRTKRPSPKEPRYNFVAFRPSPLIDSRLRTLAGATGQSISAIVRECVAAQLATMERAAKGVQS